MLSVRGPVSFMMITAAVTGVEAASNPAPVPRGGVFSLIVGGSELNAPKETGSTDIDLFEGLGYALAGGYRIGIFRFEGELHWHRSQPITFSDTLDVRSLTVNGYADFEVWRRLVLTLGAGAGTARVDVDFDTCLDDGGCPADQETRRKTSAPAYQYMFSVGWSYGSGHVVSLGYRRLVSRDLGLERSDGKSFRKDYLDMPMATIGYTYRF